MSTMPIHTTTTYDITTPCTVTFKQMVDNPNNMLNYTWLIGKVMLQITPFWSYCAPPSILVKSYFKDRNFDNAEAFKANALWPRSVPRMLPNLKSFQVGTMNRHGMRPTGFKNLHKLLHETHYPNMWVLLGPDEQEWDRPQVHNTTYLNSSLKWMILRGGSGDAYTTWFFWNRESLDVTLRGAEAEDNCNSIYVTIGRNSYDDFVASAITHAKDNPRDALSTLTL